jgi:hypothetical protein
MNFVNKASFKQAVALATPLVSERFRPRFSIADQPQYRSPPGFAPWHDHLEGCDFRQWLPVALVSKQFITTNEDVDAGVGVVAFAAMQNKAPAFFLSRELVQAFDKTQRPVIPSDLKMILPAFHLMLPIGAMPTEVPGESLSAVVVEWASGDDNGNTVLRILGIPTERSKKSSVGGHSYFSLVGEEPGGSQAEGEILTVVQRMAALASSALLTMYYEPQLVTTDPSGTGFSMRPHSRAERKRVILPTAWIGKNYKPRISSEYQGGTHARPSTHWRRGHWHHVRHGQGRELKRLCWYEPILVNKDA